MKVSCLRYGFARAIWLSLCCVSATFCFGRNCPAQVSTVPLNKSTVARSLLYTRQDGVAFARGAHADLLADLYLPARSGLHPAVIFLHGGAWKHGDRAQMAPVALALAEHGYTGMAIDYDSTTQGDRFPLALHEAERAVQWLRANAARFNVDPSRIAVAGSSAGGELAALVALDQKSMEDSKVQAAIIFNGVLDLSYTGPDAEDMIEPYLGGNCVDKPIECTAASPVKVVHRGAPPFFVGHGTDDRIVPYSQATAFVQKLRAAQVPVEAFVAEGSGHTYWDSTQWRTANITAVLKFLSEHLAKP